MHEIKFLNYLNGKLSATEVKDFERFLLLNPQNFDLLASLSRMKREFKSSDDIIQFLENKRAKFLQKLA